MSALDPARPALLVDFKSPYAWLALEPSRALEARLGIAFDWLPLAAPPLQRPTPERDGDDRGTRHRRIRTRYWEADLRRYAESRGLDLGDVYRTPDTARASLALLFVRERAPERAGAFTERVLELEWREGADIAKPETIDGALTRIGVGAADFAAFAAGEGPRKRAALDAEFAALGFFGSPIYVVGGEPFVGRQHLPMVEWLLTGRAGLPPI